MKNIIVLISIFLYLFSCKEEKKIQENDSEIKNLQKHKSTIDSNNIGLIKLNNKIKKKFIDQKIQIDINYNSKEKDFFKSKTLDSIFNTKNKTYLIGDYQGETNLNNFKALLIKSDKQIYLLLCDKKTDISYDNSLQKLTILLKDTLRIKNKDISLDLMFSNNKKGIAVGEMDIKNLSQSYFKITELYELDTIKIKLKKLNLKTQIVKCSIPIDFLNEEYLELENYFKYGIN